MALSSAIRISRSRNDFALNRNMEETTGFSLTGETIDGRTRTSAGILDAISNGQFDFAKFAVPNRLKASDPGSSSFAVGNPPEPSCAPSSPLVFEALYDHLGRWTGRYGGRLAQEKVLRSWAERGDEGAFWLVQRVTKERNLEALEGASKALEKMSSAAAPHVIAALNTAMAVSGDAETPLKFFRILEWFPREDMASMAPLLRGAIEQSSHSSNVELREAAYRCISLLPDSEDLRVNILAIETDADLRDVLKQDNG